nr:hypothetical protein Iba_chr14aCG26600 [Ipomoea batatas]
MKTLMSFSVQDYKGQMKLTKSWLKCPHPGKVTEFIKEDKEHTAAADQHQDFVPQEKPPAPMMSSGSTGLESNGPLICCLSAEAVLFLHLFFSVMADYNQSFRLDWLHSSSLLRRRLSRHLHLQQQLHPHSQHQYIFAANQEIKAEDKLFRTSDLQQQSMMMGCGGMA